MLRGGGQVLPPPSSLADDCFLTKALKLLGIVNDEAEPEEQSDVFIEMFVEQEDQQPTILPPGVLELTEEHPFAVFWSEETEDREPDELHYDLEEEEYGEAGQGDDQELFGWDEYDEEDRDEEEHIGLDEQEDYHTEIERIAEEQDSLEDGESP